MLGLSTSYYATRGKGIYDSVRRIHELGFGCAELGAAHRHEPDVWETLRRIKKDFPEMRFTVHGLFPPHKTPFWFNACTGLTAQNMDAVDNLVKAAVIVGADVVGTHPGYFAVVQHSGKLGGFGAPEAKEEIPFETGLANAREVIEFALMACEEAEIKFAVENAGFAGGRHFLRPENLKKLLEPYPELGLLLDLGHALYAGNLEQMLQFHGRVAEMHLHISPPSSSASPDTHMPLPKDFDLSPLKCIKQLREIPLIFEHSSNITEQQILQEKKLVEDFLRSWA